MILQYTEAWSRCFQVRYLHISGREVNVSLELLAKRSDDGQTDAFVASRYHGNLGGHVCPQRDIRATLIKYTLTVKNPF